MKLKKIIIAWVLWASMFVCDHNYLWIWRKIRNDIEHNLKLDGIDDNTYQEITNEKDINKLFEKLAKIDTLNEKNIFCLYKALSKNQDYNNELIKFKQENGLQNINFYDLLQLLSYKKWYFFKFWYSKITYNTGRIFYKIDKKVKLNPSSIYNFASLFPDQNIFIPKEIEIWIMKNENTWLDWTYYQDKIIINLFSINSEYDNFIDPQNKWLLYQKNEKENFTNSIIANETYHYFFWKIRENFKPKVFDNILIKKEIDLNLFNEFGSDVATLNVDIRSIHFLLSNYLSYKASNFSNKNLIFDDYKLSFLVTWEIYKKLILPKIKTENAVEIMKQLSKSDLEEIKNLYNQYY